MFTPLRHLSTGKLAVACPGQGIIPRGCLYSFKKHEDLIKPSLQLVDEVLKEKFSEKLIEQPPTEADPWSLKTSNAQPAILAATYITYELFQKLYGIDLVKNDKTGYLLGHSLGEYSALVLGGVLDFGRAVEVVRKRGLLMEQLFDKGEYTMLVLVFRPKSFETVEAVANKHGVLACVNNSSQILISGPIAPVEAALGDMPKGAVLKLVKLPVKIPFHNSLLQKIEPELAELAPEPKTPLKPIVSNLTGQVSEGHCFLNTVLDNSQPVLWKQSFDFLKKQGVEGVVGLGPGQALGDMNKRSGLGTHPAVSLDDMEELASKWGSL